MDILIDKCKRGDQQAFRKLVEANQKYAFNLAFRMLSDEDEAKEVVQESFIRVWKHLSKYNNNIKFTTWLYKIVMNLCYDFLKVRKRKNIIHTDINSNYEVSSPEDLESRVDNEILARRIEKLAKDLSDKQRAVFVLRDLQGLEISEISKVLDMSPKNVKSNLCHARKEIRNKLIKHKWIGEYSYEV